MGKQIKKLTYKNGYVIVDLTKKGEKYWKEKTGHIHPVIGFFEEVYGKELIIDRSIDIDGGHLKYMDYDKNIFKCFNKYKKENNE